MNKHPSAKLVATNPLYLQLIRQNITDIHTCKDLLKFILMDTLNCLIIIFYRFELNLTQKICKIMVGEG